MKEKSSHELDYFRPQRAEWLYYTAPVPTIKTLTLAQRHTRRAVWFTRGFWGSFVIFVLLILFFLVASSLAIWKNSTPWENTAWLVAAVGVGFGVLVYICHYQAQEARCVLRRVELGRITNQDDACDDPSCCGSKAH